MMKDNNLFNYIKKSNIKKIKIKNVTNFSIVFTILRNVFPIENQKQASR